MKISLLVALSVMLMVFVPGGCVQQSHHLSDPDRFGPHLMVEAVTDKAYYAPGEQVKIELSIHNPMSYPVTVNPFPPKIEIWLQHLNRLTKNQELIRSFILEDNEVEFEADETKTYCFIWDQKDSTGNQVTPGQYYLVQIYYKARKASGDGPISGRGGTPTQILIQHPQGPMEKTIEVNQPQTVSDLTFMRDGNEIHTDVTMTLETVELFAEGTRLSVFCSSPHYPIGNTEILLLGPPWDGNAYAQYLVDGIVKYEDLDNNSIGFRGEGVRLGWGDHNAYLDPVPSDAKELTFIITRWGDWEGPWEFHVPLE